MKIPTYLDAQEKRAKALEYLKDRMLELVNDYVEYISDDHPARIESSKEKAQKIWEEICWRKQDYDVFICDFEKDWDLNYNDYNI